LIGGFRGGQAVEVRALSLSNRDASRSPPTSPTEDITSYSRRPDTRGVLPGAVGHRLGPRPGSSGLIGVDRLSGPAPYERLEPLLAADSRLTLPPSARPHLAIRPRPPAGDALERLSSKGAYSTLPARLIAEPFTLSELQKAYEVALGVPAPGQERLPPQAHRAGPSGEVRTAEDRYRRAAGAACSTEAPREGASV
jgi:ADP-ribose pyrophosphatase YjhB (NUDIX family)